MPLLLHCRGFIDPGRHIWYIWLDYLGSRDFGPLPEDADHEPEARRGSRQLKRGLD